MLRFLMWWDEASTTFTTLPSWSPPFAFVEEIFHKGKFWSLQNTRQPNGNVNQADGYPSSEETELCGPELVTHISCFCYTWPHCSGCFSHHCSWVSFYLPLVIFFFLSTHSDHTVHWPTFEIWLVFWFLLSSLLLHVESHYHLLPDSSLFNGPALGNHGACSIYMGVMAPSWSPAFLRIATQSDMYSPYLYRDISRSLSLHGSFFYEDVQWGEESCSSIALAGHDLFLKVGEL